MFSSTQDSKHAANSSEQASDIINASITRLPSFEVLASLAKSDPVAFETLRENLCNQLIDSAPERIQQRLRGIQFQVDMERRKARTPLSACMTLSQMMRDSLTELEQVLSNPAEFIRNRAHIEADILPFTAKTSN